MKHTITLLCAAACLGGAPPAAFAQLHAPNESGVSIGHTHLLVPDVAKHVEIWKRLGAEETTLGRSLMLRVPGMYILLAERRPEAPSAETSANHIGFTVHDYADYRARLESLGASFFYENAEEGQLLADLPDGVRIEILTDERQRSPIAFHHLHVAAAEPAALQKWYLDAFGAEAGERRGLPSAVVPGGRVDFLPVRGGNAPRTSRGGAIDHIGFEVADMDAFTSRMKSLGVAFDREPTEVEAIGLTIAFITDPGGTYIEITEGLRDRE